VWNFYVGGYQVLRKWLYDRRETPSQPGRVLTEEDIAHYQRIVVALLDCYHWGMATGDGPSSPPSTMPFDLVYPEQSRRAQDKLRAGSPVAIGGCSGTVGAGGGVAKRGIED
jgi:hypothetical protein